MVDGFVVYPFWYVIGLGIVFANTGQLQAGKYSQKSGFYEDLEPLIRNFFMCSSYPFSSFQAIV